MTPEDRNKTVRGIIAVDAQRCLGCGQCLRSCALGALCVRDGIVNLVRDSWCRGQGACLGHCSADALSLILRQAAMFDESRIVE